MIFDFSDYLITGTTHNSFSGIHNNRMAAYIAQNGLCYVTGMPLIVKERELHHRLPRYYGGTDTADNLILLSKKVHRLIHSYNNSEIDQLLREVEPTDAQFKRINQLRFEAHRQPIDCERKIIAY